MHGASFLLCCLIFIYTRASGSRAAAALDLSFGDDADLTYFITRREIKVPRLNVTVHDPSRITPGFFFVAPYAKIVQDRHAWNYYQACQTGPGIYDRDGELVWSGACQLKNQNTYDFRPWVAANGSYFLSAVHTPYHTLSDRTGHAVILNSSYDVVQTIKPASDKPEMDMHEFNVLDGGKSALYISTREVSVDVSAVDAERSTGVIVDMGFREIDLPSMEVIYEWWASEHISLTESLVQDRMPKQAAWDWIHLNSIDKDPSSGDFLISARFANAIYRISGTTGDIVWKLGGTNSSYQQSDFDPIRQHDARFRGRSADGVEQISFLSNGADERWRGESSISEAFVVALDQSSKVWTAHTVGRWPRPDGQLSDARGNVQLLPNGNTLVGWGENSYISEFDSQGQLLMQANFASKRMVTYRAWKFNFVGQPREPPVLRAFAFGISHETSVTVCYVSWNGATSVSRWTFYSLDPITGTSKFLGNAERTGFETSFEVPGYYEQIFAEAVSSDGSTTSRSEVVTMEVRSDSGITQKQPAPSNVSLWHWLLVGILAMILVQFISRRRVPSFFQRWRQR